MTSFCPETRSSSRAISFRARRGRRDAVGAGRRRRRRRLSLRAQPRRIRRSVPRRSGIAGSRQAEACRSRRPKGCAGPATRIPARRPTSPIARTMRLATARRVALGRPRPATIAKLEAELADCDETNAAPSCGRDRGAQIQSAADSLHRPDRHPLSPLRNGAKPVAQAVMFCLMDVSGSMSEHMKDLAKRFYMLLYVFLNRRYRHVEIVFIRHTDRAEEVDEETFFHGPASGGTLVSSALEAMHEIVRSSGTAPRTGTSTPRRLLTATTPVGQRTAGPAADRADPAGQPVLRLSRSRRDRRQHDRDRDSPLWTALRALAHRRGASLSMRKVSNRSEIFPVFHDLFQRRQQSGREAAS